MHTNERKTVVYEYQNEQEVVMKVKELELQGVRHDDIYVLAHEKHITKRIADDTNTNTIRDKRTRIGNKYYQLFLQKGNDFEIKWKKWGCRRRKLTYMKKTRSKGRFYS